MTSKKAIKILKKHVDWFLTGNSENLYVVTPQDEQDLLEACKIATDALKKNIPVQPVPESEWPGWVTRCPTCRSVLYHSDFNNFTNKLLHVGFCIYCGQRFTKPSDTLGCWKEIKKEKRKRNV